MCPGAGWSFSPLVTRLPLDPEVWAKAASERAGAKRAAGDGKLLAQHDLDIRKAVCLLEDIYLGGH